MDALVEAHDEAEVDRAAALGATLIGVNNREPAHLRHRPGGDRATGRSHPDGPPAGHRERHRRAGRRRAGWPRPAPRAMLVGESLMRQADVAAATRALLALTRAVR